MRTAAQEGGVIGMQFSTLIRIAQTADALEDYLNRNTGSNADWPIALTADDPKDAENLAALLWELQVALKPYRAAKMPLDKSSMTDQSPPE